MKKVLSIALVSFVALGAFALVGHYALADQGNGVGRGAQPEGALGYWAKGLPEGPRFEDNEAREEARLTRAVENGQITEEQKQMIIDKMNELHDKYGDFSEMEPEVRREKAREMHEEMKTWMEENGISLGIIMRNGGGKYLRGNGHHCPFTEETE